MEEEGAGGADNIVADFNTYEEFLDFQIKPIDLYYLEVIFFIIFKKMYLQKVNL